MRPSQLIEYWSRRPLERTEFLRMIEKNYRFEEGTLDELSGWLNVFSQRGGYYGVRPFVIDWPQSYIENGYVTREIVNLTPIEYLVYVPRNTIESYISGLEGWYLNRRIPSDMPDSERRGITATMADLGWNGLSHYFNPDGETGLEIEYDYTYSTPLDDSGYIRLVYTGPKIYPYSALNYPGGSII